MLYIKTASGRYRPADAQSVREAAVAAIAEHIRGRTLGNPQDTAEFLIEAYAGRPAESFGVVWLDQKHRVIHLETLFNGTIDQSPVFVREVIRRAIELCAAAAIVTHNHPSGSPQPSDGDKAMTARIKAALDVIEVRLLDHMVVGAGGAWHSMAKAGEL